MYVTSKRYLLYRLSPPPSISLLSTCSLLYYLIEVYKSITLFFSPLILLPKTNVRASLKYYFVSNREQQASDTRWSRSYNNYRISYVTKRLLTL